MAYNGRPYRLLWNGCQGQEYYDVLNPVSTCKCVYKPMIWIQITLWNELCVRQLLTSLVKHLSRFIRECLPLKGAS